MVTDGGRLITARKKVLVTRELRTGRKPAAIVKSYPRISRGYIYAIAKQLGKTKAQKHKRKPRKGHPRKAATDSQK
jgi:hypothetical protein